VSEQAFKRLLLAPLTRGITFIRQTPTLLTGFVKKLGKRR